MSISPRILYVDDDPDGCELMAYWLKHEYGCSVTSAIDGAKAKSFIGQEFFDLYLLDYCLPDVTATSLCSDIRLISPTAPIIVYSALDRDVDRMHAIDAGADFYFVKPEQMEMIGSQIKRIFGNTFSSKQREVKFHRSQPQTSVTGHIHCRRKAVGIV